MFYMATSIALILFNKAAFAIYDFNSPNLLTLSQAVCSTILLLTFKQNKLIEFSAFSWTNFRKMLPLSLSFLAYMVSGMFSMKQVSVPMYTTLRRTTILFVLGLEIILRTAKLPSLAVFGSILLMLIGALVASYGDLNFDLFSYLVVGVYNFFTALYLVLINRISASEKKLVSQSSNQVSKYVPLNQWDYMFYNNLINIPFLIVIILSTGEQTKLMNNPSINQPGFHICLLASSLLAFLLNYAIFVNTAVNSALTQTVSGQAKDIVVVWIGYLAFADSSLDAGNLIGVCIGFLGSIAYAVAKLKSQPAASQPSNPPTPRSDDRRLLSAEEGTKGFTSPNGTNRSISNRKTHVSAPQPVPQSSDDER